ncbi:hypothetical protein SB778_14575 [Paraburkholderia sp. SIMBA_050]
MIVFERPGCVNVSGKERLADFWVRYVDRQTLTIPGDTIDGGQASTSHRHLDGAALPIRKVSPAALAAARVWIDNWQRMLACIVANKNLVSPSLQRAIERFLVRPRTLLVEIERNVSMGTRFSSAQPYSACCMPAGSMRRICIRRRYHCSLRLPLRRRTHEPPQAGVSGY